MKQCFQNKLASVGVLPLILFSITGYSGIVTDKLGIVLLINCEEGRVTSHQFCSNIIVFVIGIKLVKKKA